LSALFFHFFGVPASVFWAGQNSWEKKSSFLFIFFFVKRKKNRKKMMPLQDFFAYCPKD
jgi:hypothetical protein